MKREYLVQGIRQIEMGASEFADWNSKNHCGSNTRD